MFHAHRVVFFRTLLLILALLFGVLSVPARVLAAPPTSVDSINPQSVTAGGPAFSLTVTGSGFTALATPAISAHIVFDGTQITADSVTATQIVATVPAALIASAHTASVTVSNPPYDVVNTFLISRPLNVYNPSPTLVSITPPSALQGNGGAALTLTLTGTGFVNTGTAASSSSVQFGSTPLTPTFASVGVGLTSLTVSVPAGDPNLAAPGSVSVRVINPQPSGTSVSNPVTFTVTTNPAPTLSSINPATTTIGNGGGALTLTLTGSGFVPGATVTFGTTPGVATTFTNAALLQATIPASDLNLAIAGSVAVTVINPAPGGGPSNPLTFVVTNPATGSGLTLTLLTPSSATAGTGPIPMTLLGTGFQANAVVNFGGNVLTPTSVGVGGTSLTVIIPANSVANAGAVSVSVINPGPGGGASNTLPFTVNAPPPPTINPLSGTPPGLQPASATAGGTGFTLTINGANFLPGALVNFGGTALTPSSVSASVISVTVSGAQIAAPGTISVTVVNPGGATSNADTFTIGNPAPALSALSPASALIANGGNALLLTLTGSGFITGTTTVNFGSDNGLAATVVPNTGGTQVVVTIPSADANLATAAVIPVSVTNSGPGGGTSNTVGFTVNNPTPTINALTATLPGLVPATGVAGNAVALTINGTDFKPGAIVNFGGNLLTPTGIAPDGTSLTVTVPVNSVINVGTDSVSVVNPGPGGGASNIETFTVTAPGAPTITSLNPATVVAGSGDLPLTINGSGFLSGATVNFGGSTLTPDPASFSATSLTVVVPSRLLAATSRSTVNYNVVVTNPGPVPSNTATFTVTPAPAPTLTSLTPNTIVAGSTSGQSLSVTLAGTGFLSGATVNFGGVTLTPILSGTNAATPTSLTVSVPTSLVSQSATISVTVTNPDGAVSNPQSFNVVNPANPTITGLTPAAATAGDPSLSLTISGTGFNNTSLVNFNNNILTPQQSPSNPTGQLVVTISASLLANVPNTMGRVGVSVTNTQPGGTQVSSNAATFTINAPVPSLNLLTDTVAGLQPSIATAGSGAFTLTVTGTGFNTTTQVRWTSGANITLLQQNAPPSANPTDPTRSSFTVTVPASLIAVAGSASVAVVNTTQNGMAYASANSDLFTINNPGAVIAPLGVSPASVTVDDPAITSVGSFTLTITGTGFVNGTKAFFGGTELVTQFVSSTQLSATVPAAPAGTDLISAAERVQISVDNPPYASSATTRFNNGQPFVIAPLLTFGAPMDGNSPLFQMISVPFDFATQNLSPYDALGLVDVSSTVATNNNTAGFVAILSSDETIAHDAPLVQWAPQLANYVFAPTTPANVLRIGQGYWARFPATLGGIHGQVGLIRRGAVSTLSPQPISLTAGWDMIGDPFVGSVPLASLKFLANGVTYNADQAVQAGLVGPYLYNYDTTSSDPAFKSYVAAQLDNNQASLLTGKGYWIHVFSPCTVLVPHP